VGRSGRAPGRCVRIRGPLAASDDAIPNPRARGYFHPCSVPFYCKCSVLPHPKYSFFDVIRVYKCVTYACVGQLRVVARVSLNLIAARRIPVTMGPALIGNVFAPFLSTGPSQ